jgi:hypothetical protein
MLIRRQYNCEPMWNMYNSILSNEEISILPTRSMRRCAIVPVVLPTEVCMHSDLSVFFFSKTELKALPHLIN